jgi:hypothetical protein
MTGLNHILDVLSAKEPLRLMHLRIQKMKDEIAEIGNSIEKKA